MRGIFMPGRLNSERLPNKLILPIADLNLWEIACKKLSELSPEIEKVVLIEKNSRALYEAAKKYGNLKIIFRSKESIEVDNPLNYVFGDIDKMESDIVMFLNPCLAFLEKETVENALLTADENCCFTESVLKFNSWLYDENHKLTIDLNLKEMNTKYLPNQFVAAHAFRIFDKNLFLSKGFMSSVNTRLYEISAKEAIDVDTAEDYHYVKWRFENEARD